MRFHHIAVPLAVLFWQAVPTPRPSPAGAARSALARLGFAFATGEWEDASFNCDGDWTGSTMVPTRSAGVRFDYLASSDKVLPSQSFAPRGLVRFTAAGGRWWMDQTNTYSYPGGHAGSTFFGAQVAYEGRRIGFGLGVVRHPPIESDKSVLPSLYVRLGDLDAGHFRAEANPLSETPGMMGTVRVGIGFGEGLERRTSGFVCVAFGPYFEQLQQGVVVADLGIRLAQGVDLLVRGNAGPGAGKPQYAVGGGLRAVF